MTSSPSPDATGRDKLLLMACESSPIFAHDQIVSARAQLAESDKKKDIAIIHELELKQILKERDAQLAEKEKELREVMQRSETKGIALADEKRKNQAYAFQLEAIRKQTVEQIGNTIAELYTAARKDYDSASNDEVGLNGTPIKQWHGAYLKGCKDMAGNVISTFNDDEKEELKNKILTLLSPTTAEEESK